MTRAIKFVGIATLLGAGMALGGCVYDPAYYHRTGVVYSDGNAAVDYDDSYYSAPDYYYSPGYYGPYWGPYYGWGWPYVSLGFYGSYYGGYHHGYRGPYHPRAVSGGHPASAPTHHHH
jgi:hypothetical protein